MALNRKGIATRLRKAREDLGFTQREVADKLGLHRPAISEVEAGRRSVTSEELYAFGELFGMPIHVLLGETAPRAPDVERLLFRADAVAAPAVRAAIRRFMERCRAERELEEILGIEPGTTPRPGYRVPMPRSAPQAIRQGEEIAREERKRLDIGKEPLRNPLELLERQGVRIGPIEGLDGEGPDGVYFEVEGLGACVGVNPERDQWTGFRSAFTAAHEYAHWLLGDVQVEDFDFADKARSYRETRANAFAAAFLMPREGLVEYFAEFGLGGERPIERLSPADIVRAMDFFGVSRQALLYRLQNIGLLGEGYADELRKLTFSPIHVAKTLGITFRARRQFGERLPALAIQAWRTGQISTGRAAELCGYDIAGFRATMAELAETQQPGVDDPLLGAAAG